MVAKSAFSIVTSEEQADKLGHGAVEQLLEPSSFLDAPVFLNLCSEASNRAFGNSEVCVQASPAVRRVNFRNWIKNHILRAPHTGSEGGKVPEFSFKDRLEAFSKAVVEFRQELLLHHPDVTMKLQPVLDEFEAYAFKVVPKENFGRDLVHSSGSLADSTAKAFDELLQSKVIDDRTYEKLFKSVFELQMKSIRLAADAAWHRITD